MMTNEELKALQQLVVNTDNQRKQITPVNFTQWLKNNLTGNLQASGNVNRKRNTYNWGLNGKVGLNIPLSEGESISGSVGGYGYGGQYQTPNGSGNYLGGRVNDINVGYRKGPFSINAGVDPYAENMGFNTMARYRLPLN